MPARLLLCTDMDRTLLPNGPQPESAQARKNFSALVQHSGVALVYVTGRDKVLVEQAIDEYQLPQPDYVIADVGATIYQLEQRCWHHWHRWQHEIAPDWQGRSHRDMSMLFADIATLQLQEPSKQNDYKLSYYVSLTTDKDELLASMRSILDGQGIRASLIWSVDELAETGLLDVLPAAANKHHAIEFLMQELGCDLSNTVFAGDSGNDLAVLASPIRSVLVANASEEVRQQAEQLVAANGQGESLYFAKGDFLGMNGNYSAGILEGIAHYLPETIDMMDG